MAEPASDQHRLTDYWVRRDQLADEEWRDFYRYVRSALHRCPAPELSSLPDGRESYIDEFFTEKIFFRASHASESGIQSISGGALCGFFRRYLIDLLRSYQRTPLLDPADMDHRPGEEPGFDADGALQDFLAHLGGHATLNQSISEFLANLEDWAVLMLQGHFCADDDAVPMSALCKGIPSYHYKAQKLGITIKRGSTDLLGYEHTLIGQWMMSLGVEITAPNASIIQFLLGALCLEAVAAEGCPA
jgi:hypothetical protein